LQVVVWGVFGVAWVESSGHLLLLGVALWDCVQVAADNVGVK